jgi:7-carboxy-7-deazaguanine synthase
VKKHAVREIFNTIQGEGLRTGERSVFLRLAGCNAWNGRPEDRAKGKGACARWCDTDFAHGEPMAPQEILEELERLWPATDSPLADRWVVISGGEPGLQLTEDFVNTLHGANWHVAVETNGSVACDAYHMADLLTVSPKLGLEVAHETWAATHNAQRAELKVVLPGAVHTESAGWEPDALLRLAENGRWTALFVQPMDPIDPGFVEISHLHKNLPMGDRLVGSANYDEAVLQCLQWVEKNPQWRLSLQTHKLLAVR